MTSRTSPHPPVSAGFDSLALREGAISRHQRRSSVSSSESSNTDTTDIDPQLPEDDTSNDDQPLSTDDEEAPTSAQFEPVRYTLGRRVLADLMARIDAVPDNFLKGHERSHVKSLLQHSGDQVAFMRRVTENPFEAELKKLIDEDNECIRAFMSKQGFHIFDDDG